MIKRYLYIISLAFVFTAQAQLFPELGGQRAGISALAFLKNDVDPMSVGLGGASISNEYSGMSLFRNPALIAEQRQTTFALSHLALWGGLNQSSFAATIPGDSLSSFGIGITNLSTGAMEVRTEFQPDGTGEYFYANNLAVNFAYARILTEQFTFGANIKYVNEKLADFSNHAVGVDIGFLYKTDFKNLHFAVVLHNFGPNTRANGDFEYSGVSPHQNKTITRFPMPTVFKMGLSLDVLERESHLLRFSAQLNHPNDNAENLAFGLEYSYLQWLTIRTGIKVNVDDQSYPTVGVGLKHRIGRHPLKIEYALLPTVYTGLVHSVGFSLAINNERRDDE